MSGSEYLPSSSEGEDSDESYMSGESDLDDDSEGELFEDNEPVVDDGWEFMSDPFIDTCPDPVPLFDDARVARPGGDGRTVWWVE